MKARTPARLLLGLALVCVVWMTSRPGRAEQAIAKISLHGTGMVTRHEGVSLTPAVGQSEPDMLVDRDPHFAQDGLLVGGGLLGSLMIDGTRFALGLTLFGVRDAKIVHDPLPPGYEVEAGRLWGESLELRLGREFQLGPFFPYIDLRFAFVIEAVTTRLRDERQGVLGNTQYNRFALGLGPVGGLFIPVGDAFVDASGYAGVFGDEKYGGTLGLGVWLDL